MNVSKFRNGKLLVDEMGLREDDEKVDESFLSDLNSEFGEEFDSNESLLDDFLSINGTDGADCTSENGKSKFKPINF